MRYALPILLGIHFLLHVFFLPRPPHSTHTWRQCNTLSVARNFYEEDMNIFRPRVDNRGLTDGVTGMQFPSFEYVAASMYHLTGEQYWVARFVAWLCTAWGIIGVWFLVMVWTKNKPWALASAMVYAFGPELFYHSINPLPDILALPASIWALVYFIQFQETRKYVFLIGATFCASLAGLTKLQYLAIGVPIGVLVLQHYKTYTWKHYLGLGIFALFSVGISLQWYRYAVHLIEVSNLRDYGIEFRPTRTWQEAKPILIQNIVSDLPELLLGFAGFALFCLALVSPRAYKSKRLLPLVAWAAVLWVYHGIELSQMRHHQYYMMPYLPLLAIVAGYSVVRAQQFSKPYASFFVTFCLCILPLIAVIRIYPARWLAKDKGIQIELYDATQREALVKAVPNEKLCIVGPDVSGTIFFYMLHKRGVAVNSTLDLEKKLPTIINQKIRYLYWYHSEKNSLPLSLNAYIVKEIKKVGNFGVYELKTAL